MKGYKRNLVAAILAAIVIVAGLAACSQTQGAASSGTAAQMADDTSSTSTTASEPEYQTFGTQGNGNKEFLITNITGAKVTGLAIKSGADEAFGENLLGTSASIAEGETFRVYYGPIAEDQSSSESATATSSGSTSQPSSSEDKAVKTLYDIQLACSDGTVVVISGLNLSDMENFQACYGDGVGYVEYTSASSGEMISTKETALAAKAAADAIAKSQADAEAAAQAQAEADAAAAADEAAAQESDEQSQEEESYSDDSGDESSDQNSGESADQSSEGCLGGNAASRF